MYRLASLLLVFLINIAHATVPVVLSGPTPAIQPSYPVGSTQTFIYTIRNQVPSHSFPLTVRGLSDPVSRISVPNDCGSTIPIGPSECQIGVRIEPTAQQQGQLISQTLAIYYAGRIPLSNSIAFRVTSDSGSGAMTAVGQTGRLGLDASPLILTSRDQGEHWFDTVYSNVPVGGFFNASSCTGVLPEVICIAAGTAGSAYLVVSRDNNQTWETPNLGPLTSPSIFYSASCTGEGGEAVCIAAGKAGTEPLLFVSTDGGQTWTNKVVAGVSPGEYDSVSCAGNGATAFCAAVGSQTGLTTPILVVSTDGGQTWDRLGAGNPSLQLAAVHCGFSNNQPLCVAVGHLSNQPIIVVTLDLQQWFAQPIANLKDPNGSLNSISCAGSSTTAICSAGGRYNGTSLEPLLVSSRDGGITWSANSINGLTNAAGGFVAGSCAEMANDVSCTFVGNLFPSTPLLVTSLDGAQTWDTRTVTGSPLQVLYQGAFCVPIGQTGSCFAVGADLTTPARAPFIAMSQDAGLTWQGVPLTIPIGQLNGISGADVDS